QQQQPESDWVRVGLAGCSNLTAAVVTNPVDVVKIRLQIQGEAANRTSSARYAGFIRGLATVVRNEGLRGLYKGVVPSMMRDGGYGAIRVGLYEPVKRLFGETDPANFSLWKKICSGAVTGVLGSAVATPTDLVKVRMQAFESGARYRGTWHAFVSIYAEGGVPALYKGIGPTVARAAVVTATQVPSYDHFKHTMLSRGLLKEGLPLHFLASMFAGLMCAITTSPLDVVKTRVMNQDTVGLRGAAYSNAFSCAAAAIRTEGLTGLYKGFVPNWMRIGPHTVITFMIFEQLRKLCSALHNAWGHTRSCYVASMPAHEQFTPSELMNRCKQMKLPLGLVVDLTFTTRYYNPQEFTSQGVKYEKIFVEGHNIPDQKCISRFEAVVNQFRQESPDSVVAVHCTHGVNRTGYMICRYLIDVDGWPAEKSHRRASQQQSKARATIDPPAAVAAEAGGAAVQSANSHDGSWQNQKQSRPKPYDHPASRRKAITGFHGYNGYQPYGVQYNFGYYDSYGNYFGPNYQAMATTVIIVAMATEVIIVAMATEVIIVAMATKVINGAIPEINMANREINRTVLLACSVLNLVELYCPMYNACYHGYKLISSACKPNLEK
uniref:TYR_PHOSPHATASE_2 domain-containing protein n=1 Tax=Macrostomum lignano TaxID=282301 RepID=A0A1I8HTP7_9PLAT